MMMPFAVPNCTCKLLECETLLDGIGKCRIGISYPLQSLEFVVGYAYGETRANP